jgi:hypothetical protein
MPEMTPCAFCGVGPEDECSDECESETQAHIDFIDGIPVPQPPGRKCPIEPKAPFADSCRSAPLKFIREPVRCSTHSSKEMSVLNQIAKDVWLVEEQRRMGEEQGFEQVPFEGAFVSRVGDQIHVAMAYYAPAVNAVRAIPGASWDNQTKLWTFPVEMESRLVSRLEQYGPVVFKDPTPSPGDLNPVLGQAVKGLEWAGLLSLRFVDIIPNRRYRVRINEDATFAIELM